MNGTATKRPAPPINVPFLLGPDGLTPNIAGYQVKVAAARREANRTLVHSSIIDAREEHAGRQRKLDLFRQNNVGVKGILHPGTKHFDRYGAQFELPEFAAGMRLPIHLSGQNLIDETNRMGAGLKLIGKNQLHTLVQMFHEEVGGALKDIQAAKKNVLGTRKKVTEKELDDLKAIWAAKRNIMLFEKGFLVSIYFNNSGARGDYDTDITTVPRLSFPTTPSEVQSWIENEQKSYMKNKLFFASALKNSKA